MLLVKKKKQRFMCIDVGHGGTLVDKITYGEQIKTFKQLHNYLTLSKYEN